VGVNVINICKYFKRNGYRAKPFINYIREDIGCIDSISMDNVELLGRETLFFFNSGYELPFMTIQLSKESDLFFLSVIDKYGYLEDKLRDILRSNCINNKIQVK
jgi:hypothetical protein